MASTEDKEDERMEDEMEPRPTPSEPQKDHPFKFIEGSRKGGKVLVYNGYLFHLNSKMKQTAYFKCSEKRKGCMAGITLKNYDPASSTFDSYVITNTTHVNHMADPDKVIRREEKLTGVLSKGREGLRERKERRLQGPVTKHVCLFCLIDLPPKYDEISVLENVLPCGKLLSIRLDNPVKNTAAFDLLCSLLSVRWRKNLEGETFDRQKCLPLCFPCQNVFQEMYQIQEKIKKLEEELNGIVQRIKRTVERSEVTRKYVLDGELTQLENFGLDVFRKRFVGVGPLSSDLNSVEGLQDIKPELFDDLSSSLLSDVKEEVELLGEDANEDIPWMGSSGQPDSPLESTVIPPGRISKSLHFDESIADNLSKSPQRPVKRRPGRPVGSGRRLKARSIISSYKPKRPFTCHLCSAKILGHGNFMEHYKRVHPEEVLYSCKYCKRRYNFIGGVLDHQRRHTGDKPHQCPECGKTFYDHLSLYRHRRFGHDPNPEKHQCPHCPKICPSKISLQSHLNRHLDQVFICQAANCGKPFRSMYTFNKHNQIVHNGEATSSEPIPTEATDKLSEEVKWRLKCHLCMAPFSGMSFVRKHFQESHPEHPGGMNACHCGKVFKGYRECCRHVFRLHSGAEKPYQCDKCSYKFFTATELQAHSNTHIPIAERHKNHICHLCGMSLASKDTLYSHMKTHQKDKPNYICDICGKEYSEKRGLTQHKKIQHLKILPYKCTYEGCGKGFPCPSVLQKHLNVHEGLRSIPCKICEKTFHYSNSLSRHMREVHNVAGDEGQTPRKKKSKKLTKPPADSEVPCKNPSIEPVNPSVPSSEPSLPSIQLPQPQIIQQPYPILDNPVPSQQPQHLTPPEYPQQFIQFEAVPLPQPTIHSVSQAPGETLGDGKPV